MQIKQVAHRLEVLAMASGMVAGVAAFLSLFLEPTGLTAFGIWIGFLDEPWLKQASPYLDGLATGLGVLSGTAFFAAKRAEAKTVESR
jgi:uncharacterized membrane protein YedE/YeeE